MPLQSEFRTTRKRQWRFRQSRTVRATEGVPARLPRSELSGGIFFTKQSTTLIR